MLPLGALLVAACAYGAFARVNTYGPGALPGVWNIVLDVACSPLFVTYAVVPFWTGAALVASADAVSSSRRLRLGSDRLAIAAAAGRLARLQFWGTLAVCLGSALAGVGQPILAVPDPRSAAGRFFAVGVPPALGLIAQIMLTSVMLMALAIILVALLIRSGSWVLVVTVAALFFAWIASGANGLVVGGPSLTGSIDVAAVLHGAFPFAICGLVTIAVLVSVAVVAREQRR